MRIQNGDRSSPACQGLFGLPLQIAVDSQDEIVTADWQVEHAVKSGIQAVQAQQLPVEVVFQA